MPNVGGRRFPYTAAGRRAAEGYRKRLRSAKGAFGRRQPGAVRPQAGYNPNRGRVGPSNVSREPGARPDTRVPFGAGRPPRPTSRRGPSRMAGRPLARRGRSRRTRY